tara:strand:+ start:791 stop:1429 length:639 start_codon:yes stop_codon:yes gene_type:complete
VKTFTIEFPHINDNGFIDEPFLLKYLGHLAWLENSYNPDHGIYHAFLYIGHDLDIQYFTEGKTISISTDRINYGNFVKNIHTIDNKFNVTMITVPINVDSRGISRIKNEPTRKRPAELIAFGQEKHNASVNYQLSKEIYTYSVNRYRDFNKINILYFPNFIRIENEHIGPCMNGRKSYFFANTKKDSLTIKHWGNNITIEDSDNLMYKSIRL